MNKGYKVVGISERSGEFEGNRYDNVILHCIYEDEKTAGVGVKSFTLKRAVYNVFSAQINDVIDPYYDEYKKVKGLISMPEWKQESKKQGTS